MDKYTVKVIYDKKKDEYILPFPEGMIKEMGWEIGDNLKWIDNGDGTFSLRKTDGTERKD